MDKLHVLCSNCWPLTFCYSQVRFLWGLAQSLVSWETWDLNYYSSWKQILHHSNIAGSLILLLHQECWVVTRQDKLHVLCSNYWPLTFCYFQVRFLCELAQSLVSWETWDVNYYSSWRHRFIMCLRSCLFIFQWMGVSMFLPSKF